MPQPLRTSAPSSAVDDALRVLGRAMPVHSAWPAFDAAHPARPLVAVERDRVGAELLAPEAALEALRLQRLRAGAQLRASAVVAELRGQLGGAQLGLVDVALHLAQRDRRLGQRAVGVEDRVVRVLPALLHQAVAAAPRVLDEAVAVDVAVACRSTRARASTFGQSAADEVEVAGAARSRRRPARRTAASHRRCRSSGRTGSRASRAISLRRASCRILPGSASRSGSLARRLRRGQEAPARRAPATGRPTGTRAR